MDLAHELCPVQLLEVTKKRDNLSGWLASIQHLAHILKLGWNQLYYSISKYHIYDDDESHLLWFQCMFFLLLFFREATSSLRTCPFRPCSSTAGQWIWPFIFMVLVCLHACMVNGFDHLYLWSCMLGQSSWNKVIIFAWSFTINGQNQFTVAWSDTNT